MFAVGTRLVFDELPVSVKLAAVVSTSLTVRLCGPLATFSAVVWFAMSVIVGRSFTASTVSTKLSLRVPPSASVTVTVIVAVPL